MVTDMEAGMAQERAECDIECRILLVGRICGEDFEWHINTPVQSDLPEFVSTHMLKNGGLPTPNNLWWDGFYAEYEGHELAEMSSEYQCNGWWAGRMPKRNQPAFSELEEARLDQEFWRQGC